MGVSIYILDRRRADISIGGVACEVGTLRRFWKITEMDAERSAELLAAAAHAIPSPLAVLTAEPVELPLSAGGSVVKAHRLIGWDEGRTSVTDAGWDYLPTLGYAVRDKAGEFVLHEETEAGLVPMDKERALELNLIEANGQLVRHGQPVISDCREVRPFIQGYAEADCTLAGGQKERLLIGVMGGEMPPPAWLIGRTPREVSEYASSKPRGAASPR
jgi:hypothetical protein